MAHRVLDVFLGKSLAGHLEQDATGSMRFEYAADWLESPHAYPLSASLPLQPGKFHRNKTRPFFAGVLPEDQIRRIVAGTLGVSERNDFALLEKIGAECAGAVAVLRAGEVPVGENPVYREIENRHLEKMLTSLPQHPLLTGEKNARLSLAGAQGKLALKIEAGRYFLPLEGSPSTHILKPENPRFPGLVENEFFCMRLAERVGLETAHVETGTAANTRFLQISRFDRRTGADSRVERIHQEDFCQALGITPERKYEQEGGPNLKQCFDLVRSSCSVPGPDILRLFDAVIFNALIGNCDAHGKNFSLLRMDGTIRLAPLYDLVCTRAYPSLSAEMAMKIGGNRNPLKLTSENWVDFFKHAGITSSQARQRAQGFCLSVAESSQSLCRENCPGADAVGQIVRESCARFSAVKW